MERDQPDTQMSAKPNLQSLLLGSLPDPSSLSSDEQRERMSRLLDLPPTPRPKAPPAKEPPPAEEPREPVREPHPPSPPSHFSTLVPGLISLKGQILRELHTNIADLLGLN